MKTETLGHGKVKTAVDTNRPPQKFGTHLTRPPMGTTMLETSDSALMKCSWLDVIFPVLIGLV
jgi:hypothetical protein